VLARELDLDRATGVEGAASTHVTVEHSGFEVYGESGHEQVGGEGGWSALLKHYAGVAAR
jgi:hypothetical protein